MTAGPMQTVPPVFGAPSFRQVKSRGQDGAYAAVLTGCTCLSFQAQNGVLHLRGAVRSYYLKQVARSSSLISKE